MNAAARNAAALSWTTICALALVVAAIIELIVG